MVLDGRDAEIEPRGDLLVGEPAREEPEDLDLARGQPGEHVIDRLLALMSGYLVTGPEEIEVLRHLHVLVHPEKVGHVANDVPHRIGVLDELPAHDVIEVDALYHLVAAGVRVPRPHGYFDGVLIMELVTDDDGNPAPRLGEVELSAETAREYHGFLIRQVVRMLCIGLIHGDLSEFNVLVAPDGPVIIDLPQAVNAAGNNAARAMLERDVNNLRSTLGRFAPELLATEFAREMWSLFEQGELRPDSVLTGIFAPDETVVDPDSVLIVIDDAREEELQRRLRLVD